MKRFAVVLSCSIVGSLALEAYAAADFDQAPTVIAPAEAPTPQDAPSAATPKKRGHQRVEFGLLGAVGLPRPFALEAMIKVERVFAIGAEYSFLPTSTIDRVDIGYHAFAADARIFPFSGPFFFGARLGKQNLDGNASVTVAPYGTFTGSTSVDTWFVNPRVGFLWTFKGGVSLGLDVGVQIPLSHSQKTSLPDGVTPPSSISETIDVLGGKSTIPTVSLLQLGMLL